jgi:hypothetical protein
VKPDAEALEQSPVVGVLGLAGGVQIDDPRYDPRRIRGRYPRQPALYVLEATYRSSPGP